MFVNPGLEDTKEGFEKNKLLNLKREELRSQIRSEQIELKLSLIRHELGRLPAENQLVLEGKTENEIGLKKQTGSKSISFLNIDF